MSNANNPAAKNIEQSLVDRISGAMRYVISGVAPSAWMTPGQPLQPLVQDQAAGRTWDYPVGYNLRIIPRGEEPVTFEMLRGLADSYDLLRLIIETRKDQLCCLDWTVRIRDTCEQDARCKKIMEMLQYPDRINAWDAWLRILLEDMFVIYAATVYLTRSRDGDLYALDIIDGATIRPLIDSYGRQPAPPSPAYQQLLKGVPAADYKRDDLLYVRRNPRSNRVYGLSHVEQIIMTVNIAMRRQIWQLSSFTEGNVPDSLIGVPDNWTPTQIKQFQEMWDGLLTGELEQRRRAKFVPGGISYTKTVEDELFGKAEEWLARVICFAFSISPQPFVQQQNRATAETAKASAEEEGLVPIKNWASGVMNRIIAQVLGFPDLEFQWSTKGDIDPLVQAQIDQIYIETGVYSQKYVAARIGIEKNDMPAEVAE